MIKLIKEIEQALESKLFRVALGMALTLPDICGKIEYPKEKVGERYKKWCDNYLKNQEFILEIDQDKDKNIISGEICYKLRCAYLHSGNTQLNEKGNDVSIFNLCINLDYASNLFEGEKKIITTINIEMLIKILCDSAKDYYEKFNNKYIFLTHDIYIDDAKKSTEIYREAKNLINNILSKKKDKSDQEELSNVAKEFITEIKLAQNVLENYQLKESELLSVIFLAWDELFDEQKQIRLIAGMLELKEGKSHCQ